MRKIDYFFIVKLEKKAKVSRMCLQFHMESQKSFWEKKKVTLNTGKWNCAKKRNFLAYRNIHFLGAYHRKYRFLRSDSSEWDHQKLTNSNEAALPF